MPSNIIFVHIMVHHFFQELTIFYFTTLTVYCVYPCSYTGKIYFTHKRPTLVKVLVIRDWMLLVVVLNVLQLWAMRRAAKSRKAQ